MKLLITALTMIFISFSANAISIKNLSEPFVEKWPYLLPNVNYNNIKDMFNKYPDKTKLINFVYSKKTGSSFSNYGYRHKMGEMILNNNINIDIYGGSVELLKKKFGNRNNIKYSFAWKDVDKIYRDYKFSIAIENFTQPEYFSEKIIIPLLCGSIPIYLGCNNIDKYFKDYVIKLSGDLEEDKKLINNILENPDKYYKEIPISEIWNKIHLKNLIHEEFLIKNE